MLRSPLRFMMLSKVADESNKSVGAAGATSGDRPSASAFVGWRRRFARHRHTRWDIGETRFLAEHWPGPRGSSRDTMPERGLGESDGQVAFIRAQRWMQLEARQIHVLVLVAMRIATCLWLNEGWYEA
jgi:hypothetical protein